MQYDPETEDLVSGSDKRLRYPARSGARIRMPGQGIWMSLSKEHVLDYYAVHDHNALVEFSFDPNIVIHGNLTDLDTEFTVPSARITQVHILQEA